MAIHEECLKQVVLKEYICVFLSKVAQVDRLTFSIQKKFSKTQTQCGSTGTSVGIALFLEGRSVIIRKSEMRGGKYLSIFPLVLLSKYYERFYQFSVKDPSGLAFCFQHKQLVQLCLGFLSHKIVTKEEQEQEK